MAITIRNKRTGEIKVINETEAPSYGVSSVEAPKPQEDKSFASKISDFFIGRTKDLARNAGQGFDLRANLPDIQQRQEDTFNTSRQLIEKARQTSDPIERSRLLQRSRELDSGASNDLQRFLKGNEQEYNQTLEQGAEQSSPLRQGIGVAGELGSFLLPQTKIGAVGKFSAPVVEGAAQGLLYAGTDPNTRTPAEHLLNTTISTLMGAASAKAVKGLIETPQALSNAVTRLEQKVLPQKATDIINRIVKPSLSKLKSFNKSSSKPFAEKFVEEDLSQVAGKNFNEMADYFTKKNANLGQQMDKYLQGTKLSVDKKKVLDVFESKISGLKDRIGQKESKSILTELFKDTKELPGEKLSLDKVNQMIRDSRKRASSSQLSKGVSEQSPTTEAVDSVTEQLQKLIKDTIGEDQRYDILNEKVRYNFLASDTIDTLALKELRQSGGLEFGSYAPLMFGVLSGNSSLIIASLAGTGYMALRKSPKVQTKIANKFVQRAAKGVGKKVTNKEVGQNIGSSVASFLTGRAVNQGGQ